MKSTLTLTFVFLVSCLTAQSIEWTNASGNSLWSTASNWSTNSVPTLEDNVVVTNANGTSTIYIDENAEVNVLTITGITVVINQYVDLMYSEIDGNGDLLISKNAALIPNAGASGLVNDSQELNIIITHEKNTTSASHYAFLSVPVERAQASDLTMYGANNVYGLKRGASKDPQYSFKKVEGQLEVGAGYAVNGNFTVNYIGTPNNGDIDVLVIKNPEQKDNGGLNMLGNPYPSPISAYEFLSQNEEVIENGTLYFAEVTKPNFSSPDEDRASNIVAVNATGASVNPKSSKSGYKSVQSVDNYIIQAGVGFQLMAKIKKKGNGKGFGSGTASFNNGMRVSTNTSSNSNLRNGGGKVALQNGEYIWLEVMQTDAYASSLVAFGDQASNEQDYWYDAMIVGGMSGLDLGTKIGDDVFSINTLSNNQDSLYIPISMNFRKPGQATIKISEIKNIHPSRRLYLHDLYRQEYIHISGKGDSIEFFVADTGLIDDRFVIVSNLPSAATSVESIQSGITFSNQVHGVQVQNAEGFAFQVYTTHGALVQTGNIQNSNHLVELASGAYVLNLVNNKTGNRIQKKLVF